MINYFSKILVNFATTVVVTVFMACTICVILPFVVNKGRLPSFVDPEMGFSTRGTEISTRLTTWQNLVESTRSLGPFTVNPKELLMLQSVRRNNKKKRKYQKEFGNLLLNQVFNISNSIKKNDWKLIKTISNSSHFEELQQNGGGNGVYFCGIPDEKYSHFVIKATNNNNLLSMKSLMDLCELEYKLTILSEFKDLCVQYSNTNNCCRPWSLANSIALLHNRTSCLGITKQDVNSTLRLLSKCSKYFFNLKLVPGCYDTLQCEVPLECAKYDETYNILNFLVSTDFITSNMTDFTELKLTETIIFLPMAASTATLNYYKSLKVIPLEFDNLKVVAMDLGLKNALFDESLIHDAWFMLGGMLFIMFCIWFYTESLLLTVATISAIVFSLGISYFLYVLVLKLKFFPFMNLLTIIVAIGLGSDDAFIFCKIWHKQKLESNESLIMIMSKTLRHANASIFLSTLTTLVAFFSSYVNSVMAIRCFSIFASTAVLINFILMILWFPACVVLWEKSNRRKEAVKKAMRLEAHKYYCSKTFLSICNFWFSYKRTFLNMFASKEITFLKFILKFRYIWINLLSIIGVGSIIIVLYYPKLRLPNSQEFQLFTSSHPFEQYDFVYKNHFWFHRQLINSNTNTNYELPLRFVWGVLPVDNGDHLDPTNYGNLELDPDFNMSDPSSQVWLLKFCKNLKKQPFFRPMMGPLLPNCFIETFLKSMQRTCVDFMSGANRTPCCKSSAFPFSPEIFDKCIIQEMADIYQTPTQFLLPGIAGPKFSKDQNPTIKAVVVEYISNYSYSMSYDYMNEFYTQVEKWTSEQLKSAPKGMKNGWFISLFNFYDLQSELANSTLYAIFLSSVLALVVLLFSTLNILISIFAIITISFSIFVTIALLVLLGWKLNILESIAISTAIGLVVDFSLHYSVNYKLCPTELINDRLAAAHYTLSNMCGPSFMAAVTTGAAGAFMLPSIILPYIQIGIFLLIVMSVSWIYATFFLGSLLAVMGPRNNYCQFSYSNLFCSAAKSSVYYQQNCPTTARSSISDTHELKSLTGKF